ncbi:MAG: hypothetical protein AAFU85_24110 [Planctomycetota bacterium]
MRSIALGISVAIYIASLTMPCYSYGQQETVLGVDSVGTVYGGSLLLIGWMGVLSFEFAWFANPLYLCACAGILASRKNPCNEGQAALLALMPCFAIAFALSFLMYRTTAAGGGPAGTEWVITAYLPGYYLWIASMVALLLASPTKRREGTAEDSNHDGL